MDAGSRTLTTPALLRWRTSQSPRTVAVQYHDGTSWRTVTYEAYDALVSRLADALQAMGLRRGDRVAIFADTCFEWAVVDLAVQSFAGVLVAIHPAYSTDEVLHALRVARPSMLFYGGEKPSQAIEQVLCAYERPLAVFALHDDVPPRPGGRPLSSLLRGSAPGGRGSVADVRGSDLATIVFTSGTAGMPKAVGLSHANLVSTAQASFGHLGFRVSAARSLHWLPFAHLFGRIGLYLDLVAGATATYARGLPHLAEDIRFAAPHFLFTVPKALSRFHDGIMRQTAAAPAWRRLLFRGLLVLASGAATRRVSAARWIASTATAILRHRIAPAFGGNLQLIVVGSAPVAADVCELFEALGIPIAEGYGMTETSGVACVNPYRDRRPGTVGTPIPTIELALDADGELLARGPSVFQGYLDPAHNIAAFTPDGWFRTGDLATRSPDGYVQIIGRKKDIIITDGGENVTPERVETALTAEPFIKDAIVIGDRRPYLVAVIDVDAALVPPGVDLAECARRAVETTNHKVAAFERIRQFVVASEDFSVENGQLTTSLKKRRRVIEDRYRDEIEALYIEHAEASA
jgi:long-chain acyl-CoA synthetase